MKKRKSLPHTAAKAVAAFTKTGAESIPSDVQGSYTGITCRPTKSPCRMRTICRKRVG